MPRTSLPFGYEVQRALERFPDFQYNGTEVQCRVCEKPLGLRWRSWRKHTKSSSHIKNCNLQLPYWVFMYDLILVLNVCNIPPNMVDNERFRLFWKKSIPGWTLPTAGQLRRHFVHVKEEIEKNILSDLRDKKLWVTVDETTDKRNNKVGNVLVRILTENHATLPYVIASKRLEKTTPETIEHLVEQALDKFCIQKNNILLLVTDGSVYMSKAGTRLKQLYPNAMHITCLFHAFHRVAETIRINYPHIDKLIASTKNVFLKSPQRIQAFHTACPGIPEPPQPILTRWGTWLNAAFYYNKYFHAIKSVVFTFNPTEMTAIMESQQQFNNPQVEADLRAIQEKYSLLGNAIDQLQDSSLSLVQAINIVDNVSIALQNLTDTFGVQAATKFNDLISKNPDFAQLRQINTYLRHGQHTSDLQCHLAYAHITSLDTEHSFSQYHAIFRDQRTNLKEATIEGILMLQAYARIHPFQ